MGKIYNGENEMRRTYLIDSENINDVWVELLQVLEDEDEILVFYTDKSAHMGYDRIVCLMEQKRGTVHWIKCFEGQNALDFQLVTELGSCLSRNGSREYIIVSNDTGYDAVVRYWQQKGCSVRRIKGADCEKGAPAERRQEMLSEKALTEKSGQKASEKIPSEKSGQDVSSEKVPSEKKTPAATSEQAPAEKKGRKAKAKKTGAAANRCAEQVRKETECTERESGEALNKSAASAAESHEEEADKSAASAAESHEEEADKLPASAVESRGEEPEKPASSVKKAHRKKSPKAASAEKECGELCEMAVPAENGLEEAEASAEKECMEASEKTVEEDGKEAEESGSCRQEDSEENIRKKRKNRRKKSQKEKKEEIGESVMEDIPVFTEEPEPLEEEEAVFEQELFGDEEENRESGTVEADEKQSGGGVDCREALLKIFRRTGSREPEEDCQFLLELCKTLKLSNMSLVHNVMEYHFGLATGNGIYRFIRENPGCRGVLSAGYSNNKKERERRYLELILTRNERSLQEGDLDQILKILNGIPKKNLNGIHSALLRRFGQEDGGSLYAVLRNHVKIIRAL